MNDLFTVQITDLAASGGGIARDESGRVLFVPLSAPGDRLKVRVTKAERRYAEAEIVEILEPSPERVQPRCAVFGKCGGCSWQHIPYPTQWRTKARGLEHMLARRQIALPRPLEEFPADESWGYRNRVQLRGEGTRIGFLQRRSLELVPIERCEIARPELNASLKRLRAEGAQKRRPYKVEIEAMPDGSVRESWNAGHAALGFRQVNDAQNEKIRRWLASALTPGSVLYDLYGGSGNFSLPLAQAMPEIHCVDVGSRPAPDAPAHLHFHRAAVVPWLLRQKAPSTNRRASAILDPPREGLDRDFAEIESGLRRLGVNEIAAVGCDANAWAQDVARFLRTGWRLERVAAFDLFPQTPHIEGIALLVAAR